MNVIDDSALRRARAVLLREFPVRPRRYWIDMLGTAAIGWTLGLVAVMGPGWLAPVAVVVAALAAMRAAYFVHDISHVRHRLPGFEVVWNLVVGAWVLLPSFMADAHVEHHRGATYGTQHDPEYEPVATWSRARIVGSIALAAGTPLLLVIRFGVLGPLSWFVPGLRTLVWARASTVQTNPTYVRRLGDPYAPRTVACELLAVAVLAGATVGLVLGVVPVVAAVVWLAIAALAFAINQARTLTAHVYAGDGVVMSLTEQVADTTTINGGFFDELVAPLGTRFHALHHLAPNLPYHALAAAHRRMLELAPPAAYHRGAHAGVVAASAALWAAAPGAARDRSSVETLG